MKTNKLHQSISGIIALGFMAAASQSMAVTLSTEKADVTLYGYANLNASYDINEDISATTRSGAYSRLGGPDENIKGHFGMDAYQSRLGLRVATEEGYKVTIETDFRGGATGGQLRLRHAFADYDGWIMGQTWSNYTSFVGYAQSLDFDGTPGLAGRMDRVAQIRYTTGNLSFAIEEPMVAVVNETNVRRGLPDFSARYESGIDNLKYSMAAYVHQVTVDDGVNDDSALGFAGFFGASFSLTDSITLHGVINYSDGVGIGLYRSGDNAFVQDAYMKGNTVETLSGYAGTVGASFALNNERSINVAYGAATTDWDDAEKDLAPGTVAARHKLNEKAFINYLWSPVPNTMMGVEYAYFNTDFVSGDSADANRLMFSAQYSF